MTGSTSVIERGCKSPSLHQRAPRLAFVLALIVGVLLANTAFGEDSKTCNLSIKILGLETDEGNLIVVLIDSAEAFDANGAPI
ncbi:MAG: hypothetical protein VCB25_10495, partial [Myxococcota bacterium]